VVFQLLIGSLSAEIENAMVKLKIVKFQADAKDLAGAKDFDHLTILSMVGQYKQPVQYGKGVRP
jgi:hypothetical protein